MLVKPSSFNLFFLVFFGICFYGNMSIQAQTKPIISNFIKKDYRAHNQNWGFAQDSRGIIYVANNDNVLSLLEYDGSNWRSHATEYKSSIYSLAIDSLDRIFVGGESEFGLFKINDKGGLVFQQLSELLPDSLQDFSYVWCTHIVSGKVFFQSKELLAVFDRAKLDAFLPLNYFHKSFVVNGEFWVRDHGKGFFCYKNKGLQFVKGTEAFADIKVDFILPFKQDTLLVGTRSDGFFLFETRSGKSNKIQTELDDAWTSYDVYGGIKLKNGNYAVITLSNGLYILDNQLHLVQHISREDGLQSEKVWGIFEDLNQNIWLALHKGIAMMEAENPIYIAQEGVGYSGEINDMIRHKGKLYIATSQGVFLVNERIDPGLSVDGESSFQHFVQVKGINEICWDLLSDGEDLFVAGNYAVYKINRDTRGNELVEELAEGSPRVLRMVTGKQRKLLVGGSSIQLISENSKGKWVLQWEYDELPGEARSILVEPKSGSLGLLTLWAAVSGDGLYRLDIDPSKSGDLLTSIIRYDTATNLDPQYLTLSWIRDHLVIGTAKGLVSFNAENTQFVRDFTLGEAFCNTNRQVYKLHQGANGEVLAVMEERLYRIKFGDNGSPIIDSLPYRTLDIGLINGLLLEKDGKAWIGGSDGLAFFEINRSKDLKRPYATAIRRVNLRSGDTLFLGNYFKLFNQEKVLSPIQQDIQEVVLEYKQNSLVIEYAAIRFEANIQMEYTYLLEGYEDEFTPYTTEHKATYTNLSPGSYKFRVKARDVYGNESAEAQFKFIIRPPWYSTWWFYLIQVSSLLGLVVLSYVANRSGGNSRLSHILTFVTIITIFEFIILIFEGYLDQFSGGVPVFKLLMNVVLAVSINPLEKLFTKLLAREEAT